MIGRVKERQDRFRLDANKVIGVTPIELRAAGLDPKRVCINTGGGVALSKYDVIVARFTEMIRQTDELIENVAGAWIDDDAPCRELLITRQRRWLLLDRKNVYMQLPMHWSLAVHKSSVQTIARQYGAGEINR